MNRPALISVFSDQRRTKSTTRSRTSCGTHTLVRAPQDFFLRPCAQPSIRPAPHPSSGSSFPGTRSVVVRLGGPDGSWTGRQPPRSRRTLFANGRTPLAAAPVPHTDRKPALYPANAVLGCQPSLRQCSASALFACVLSVILTEERSLQFQLRQDTKHHVPIFAPLATLDVNYHALAVDVRNFQVGQLGASHSGSVERHQQRAMKGSASRIDESRHFFLAHDRWNVLGSFRIGGLGCAPALLESLGIEEPQSRKIYRNGARRQVSLLEQFRLVFANLLGAQTVWRTLEASREIFHYTDVTAYGSFSVITTLEFLQQTVEQPTLHYLTRSVRRRAASFKSPSWK